MNQTPGSGNAEHERRGGKMSSIDEWIAEEDERVEDKMRGCHGARERVV